MKTTNEDLLILRSAVDNSTDSIFVKDHDFRFLLVNKTLANSMGFTPDEMEGKYDYEFWSKDRCEGDPDLGIAGYHDHDLKCLNGSHFKTIETVWLESDDKYHIFETHRTPLKTQKGKVYAVLGCAHDITAESQVKERTQLLEEINNELGLFSHTISHDLRNPLFVISAYSELLLANKLKKMDNESIKMIEEITRQVYNIEKIINSLLTLSSGHVDNLSIKEFNLSELIGNVFKDNRNKIKDRVINIRIQEDITVKADPDVLYVALTNIISNSIKYTENNKEAEMKFYVEKIDGKETYCIEDNGIGFEMSGNNDPFGAFNRMESSKGVEGYGVGLNTVKRIILKHNGQVWIDSKPQMGSKIYFTLG